METATNKVPFIATYNIAATVDSVKPAHVDIYRTFKNIARFGKSTGRHIERLKEKRWVLRVTLTTIEGWRVYGQIEIDSAKSASDLPAINVGDLLYLENFRPKFAYHNHKGEPMFANQNLLGSRLQGTRVAKSKLAQFTTCKFAIMQLYDLANTPVRVPEPTKKS